MFRVIGIAIVLGLFTFFAATAAGMMMQSSQAANDQQISEQPKKGEPSSESQAYKKGITWGELWERTKTDPVAFFTFMLAIFSGGLLAVAGLQIWLLVRAEDVSRAAVSAAEKSADVARTALISTQRAFLFPNMFEVHVINNDILIMPQWKNSGNTPANPVINYVNWMTLAGEPPTDFTYPDLAADGSALPEKKGGIIFYMGPQTTSYAEPLKIPVATMGQVKDGRLRLFIWGWIQYRDIVDNTAVHRTEFCNEVVVTDMGKKDDKTTIAVTFAKYGPYNTAN